MPPITLTAAQQAVVAHDKGPALVFAVAGAGKTTAMVHRIERLVRDGVFPAGRILATSFGKGNQQDLQQRLAQWPQCRSVGVRTLHALGRGIIARAQRAGYWPNLRLNRGEEGDHDASQHLLGRAIYEARRRVEPYAPELETLDRQDFLSYVDACKGNLLYADLQAADLPPQAQSIAGQAQAPQDPLGWYLDLYRLFEEVRLQQGAITFADMLMIGWETLLRYPDVLAALQEKYTCVVVDEFQDINLAQSEILDLITQPHRNYMAIGDDDQTIYEWRGADPHFILDFEERYSSAVYTIDANFRSPAGPLLLANNVIAHNRRRAPKRLQLTQGFEGQTAVHVDADLAAMARRIVDKMVELREAGWPWNDMAVLVRLNAQTPYVEQALIAAEIPFRVSKPFYERREIKTLIYYVRLAWVEWALQTGKGLTAQQEAWFAEAWRTVYNRPKRYLSRQLHDRVQDGVLQQALAPTVALRQVLSQAPHEGIAERIEELAEDVAWLAVRLKSEAADTLQELVERLAYKDYLRESSGFPQTGEGRAAGVDAFGQYARGKGNVLDFMQHVRSLSRQKIGREPHDGQDAVTLSTIHGAKGLEWPAVFVAQCNQDVMPFNGERAENLEEERRLFYVALTRSSSHLFLHAVRGQRFSQFLREARWEGTLAAVQRMREILCRDPQSWQAADALALARDTAAYGLQSYLERWWQEEPQVHRQVVGVMQRFMSAVERRQAWEQLGLSPEVGAWWRQMAPAANEAEKEGFPGLSRLLDEVERTAPTSEEDHEQTLPPPGPIHPGMWVLCDAGWGRIEGIVDGEGRALSEAPPELRRGSLQVTLRPANDALPLQIDLASASINFGHGGHLYTCLRCQGFSSNDPHLVSGAHNAAAHGGVGASYRREKAPQRPLKRLVFREVAPPNALA